MKEIIIDNVKYFMLTEDEMKNKFKEPLLITEDGVEIFDEKELLYDTVDINDDCNLCYNKTSAFYFIEWKKNNICLDRKCWYHKENAEKYVDENKLKYSIKDIDNALLESIDESNNYNIKLETFRRNLYKNKI